MDDDVGYERENRSSVLLKAVYQTGHAPVQRRVRNLSAHGACIDVGGDLAEGMHIRLAIGCVETLAEVVWANESAAGLHFDDVIDLALARTPKGETAAVQRWLVEGPS